MIKILKRKEKQWKNEIQESEYILKKNQLLKKNHSS